MKHLLALLLAALSAAASAQISASIASPATCTKPVVITAYDYTAGAICSVTWNGVQFIDFNDHGRCLQTATSFDNQGESFNPTEAGREADGLLPNASTSVLGAYTIAPQTMSNTVTQMAFWRGPTPVSSHSMSKTLTAGYSGKCGVTKHAITLNTPPGETHTLAVIEWLTGYMTSGFTKFYTYNPTTQATATLSAGPGEQSLPIIFANSTGTHAMGIWSPRTLTGGGYGRWTAAAMGCQTGCTKWNTVERVTNPPPGASIAKDFYTIVGTLSSVKADMRWLYLNTPHD